MPNLPGLRALEASGNEAGGKGPHALDASVRVSGFRVLGASFGFIWEFPKIRGTLLLFRLLYSGPLFSETPICWHNILSRIRSLRASSSPCGFVDTLQ